MTGRIKLNTGSLVHNSLASTGAIAWDHQGRLIWAFALPPRRSSREEAELVALFLGMSFLSLDTDWGIDIETSSPALTNILLGIITLPLATAKALGVPETKNWGGEQYPVHMGEEPTIVSLGAHGKLLSSGEIYLSWRLLPWNARGQYKLDKCGLPNLFIKGIKSSPAKPTLVYLPSGEFIKCKMRRTTQGRVPR